MRRWLVVALIALILSGCSWDKFTKWLDQYEWERPDKTIHIVDFLLK
jgi:hypothetical protein